ncbi:MAG: hypothetical protein KAV87_03185 [Desulfobacteraceae bacterium]|nr:hypothetical protein [Desulfobacteraceae bacterium]
MFAVVGAVGAISALALWGTRGDEDMAFYGGLTFMQWYPLLAIPPFVFMGLSRLTR